MTLMHWLQSLDGITNIKPVAVTIKGKRYDGASYIDEKHEDGETRLYLLGPLPACYRRSSHTVFRFPGDDHDWYVATYWTKEWAARQGVPLTDANHPFGEWFMLVPWILADAIDHHERRPYHRVASEIHILH